MNLPLHMGLLGVIEAMLIAFAIGLLVCALWQWICKRCGWSAGHALGWACVFSVAIAAGVDIWNMFYLGMVRLESPLYARMALENIHDPDSLGTRVLAQAGGALAGVGLGWYWFSRGWREESVQPGTENGDIGT